MKAGTFLIALVVFSLVLAACGGAGPEPTQSPVATTTPAPTETPVPDGTDIPTPGPTPTPETKVTPTLPKEATPTPGPLPTTSIKGNRPPVLDRVDRPPPIASLINIGTPATDGTTLVTGAPGAVPGSVQMMVATVEYGDHVLVTSSADGSFNASVISAPGATVQVRYNPYEPIGFGPEGSPEATNWPGTLIRMADAPASGSGTPFSSASSARTPEGAVLWAISGSVADRTLEAGDNVSASGTVRVYIPEGVTAPASLSEIGLTFGIDLIFDVDGKQGAAGSDFVSRLLTPTGLPIERTRGAVSARFYTAGLAFQRQGDALVASFDASVPLPSSLPPGTYRLYVTLGGIESTSLGKRSADPPGNILGFEEGTSGGATVALLTIGSPGAPRLSPALFVDSPNQGSRGTIADEDRGRYEFASRITTQPDAFIIEPRDPGDGQLIPYRLEPFFPFLSLADRTIPNAPIVPLDLPKGSLAVSVRTPSGTTEELGTSAILQTRTGQETTSAGFELNNGGGHPGDVLQLTTLSDAFAYRFAEYGGYTISLSGSASDIWGQDYPFSGTFQVWAAETLDVETASLPSTPFQVGDRLPAVANVYPGVPADIEMSLELHPIDGSPILTASANGIANRFGYFDGAGKTFEFNEAGEYILRVRASYTDNQGRLWMGTRRWGSGVAPVSPALIAHGRRGDDSQPISERRAWFNRAAIGVAPGPNHIGFPYHSGDIVWATDDDSLIMLVTVQDIPGQIANLIRERVDQSSFNREEFLERRTTGELPLLISTSNGLEATFSPADIDQWGYTYRAVERPGVRVREMVGTDSTKSPYWRFQDLYLAQRGMGVEGDRPNDIKWQFGAAVFKHPELGIGEVAIYGSLWVEIPGRGEQGVLDSRVFPPFQGAAGGPSGGPIMTLKGEEIDLFVMPTAVRPGGVLEVGDRFVFAGQVGPPLNSKVTVQVTSPSGVVHTTSGQANSIGYFSSPTRDFVVDEPGIWSVEVEVLHDGLTSAGPVEPPYPTGSVLGSTGGRYQFYVASEGAAQLDLGLPVLSFASDAPAEPVRFFPRIPEGWTNVEGVYTISMSGFILEEGTARQRGGVLEVAYDPRQLSRDFPNIDLRARHSHGAEGLSDEIFVSILLSGTNSSGQQAYAAKLLTLVGEDIYNLN